MAFGYPVVTPILVTPIYLPAAALVATHVETDLAYLRLLMDKVAGSVVAALSAAVLFLALRRLTTRGLAPGISTPLGCRLCAAPCGSIPPRDERLPRRRIC